eukprot:CAMPEP_0181107868 /NCGR_PEP_ID=MMETSP1071-20121207/17316_1 /TAXON_ID=35127 /ORGANISM="Thalassiosira sp., Strain NH16" /LENGTH=149 /DNA_ID=CAMNT_0023191413 /DNA_START=99 /DNA_END=548 /DNA_ORIENTATION=+
MTNQAIAIAIIASLYLVSTDAALPARRRIMSNHKSLPDSPVHADEAYDPYLGMGGERRLEGHEDHTSMPMGSMMGSIELHASMPSGEGETPPAAPTPGTSPTPGSPTTPTPGSTPTYSKDSSATSEDSGASTIGTAVSALAAAGAMMFL